MSFTFQDASLVKGMLARGDKQHDIAAHFGVNPGRIAEVASGQKWSEAKATALAELPPRKQPRFIDPNVPVVEQFRQLMRLIEQPPETSRVLVITPGLAEVILKEMNPDNRKRRPKKIKDFAASMASAGWILTGDTLKFSRRRLLDGQNRLSGCVRSQVPFMTHVVFGIDEKAFTAIDAGTIRTKEDTFQVAGVPYYGIVSGAVRWLMIDKGDRGQTFENRALWAYYSEHIDSERMQVAAKLANAVPKIFPQAVLASYLYRFAERDQKLTEKLASDLIHNKSNGGALLRKLRDLKLQNLGRLHEDQVRALLILTWNAMRQGRRINAKALRWTNAEEKLPDIA